ncbi:MFS transporter [Nocardia sp. NPDC127579]|uniref:MFS transporter n=1 Tax=Nocardia sp. NPDC127579 TaxID=3345402 RepID=UPI00363E6492
MSSIASGLRRARAADSVAFALQGFFFAVVLTELPQQQDEFGLSDGLIAGSIVVVSLLAGGGSVLAEQLAVRWSSRATLRLGLVLISGTGAGIAFAPTTPALLAALCCYGVALGMVDASTNMQAVFIQHGYGTFILASFYAAWSAGSITGALFVAGAESLDVPLRETLLAAAILVLIAGAALGPWLLGTDAAEASTTEQPPRDALPEVALRAYLAFGIAMALVFGIDLAVGSFSALYLESDVLGATAATAALGLAAYQGSSLLARLTGDRWVRRFGPRRVVRAAAAIGVAGLALVVAAPVPGVAIAGFLIAGFGLPVIAPLCFGEAGRLAAGPALDSLIARLNLFNYAGTLIGGGLVGALAAGAGHRIAFVVPMLFAAALFGLATTFHTRPQTGVETIGGGGHVSLDK